MSRIQGCFDSLKKQERKALIPFITGGHPDLSISVAAMHAMVAGGADIIELGVPFSDPMADGPVIQKSSEMALEKGVSLAQILAVTKEFRQQNTTTPVVIMTYLNPIEVMGYEKFVELATAASIDGVLVVDMPPEEGSEFRVLIQGVGLDLIHLIAPTTGTDRLEKIALASSGYVYYVSLRGVTGAGHLDIEDVSEKVADIRDKMSLPIAVGFGIKDPETAKAVGEIADGVIVGSALVEEMHAMSGQTEAIPAMLKTRLEAFRTALDG